MDTGQKMLNKHSFFLVQYVCKAILKIFSFANKMKVGSSLFLIVDIIAEKGKF